MVYGEFDMFCSEKEVWIIFCIGTSRIRTRTALDKGADFRKTKFRKRRQQLHVRLVFLLNIRISGNPAEDMKT